MKIRWFEVVVLVLTGLCALCFFANYLVTVRSADITITTRSGGAYELEETQEKGVEYAETGESTIGKLDLNSATLEELMTLPGIGESKAQAIIDYRLQHGGFSSIEELIQVDGIGKGLFEKIKNRVTVS